MHHPSPVRSAAGALLLFGLSGLAACDRELPTEVGSEHIPESQLRTYELILDDAVFLTGDSIVRGFGTSQMSPILLVAENWRDTIDAHALVQFGDFPETVTYVDSTGLVTDTVVRFVSGRIVVLVDTAALQLDTTGTPDPDTTIAFDMYELAEAFDPRTTTWTARSITGLDTTFWTTPGGTTGDLLGSETWTRSDTVLADSMFFDLDSATVAAWAAGTEADRAILLTTATEGARVQLAVPRLQLTAVLKNDTTRRTVSVIVAGQAYVFDPPPPAPLAELRLGDRSAWRSYLTFAPGLDSLTLACPGVPDCSFRLGDVAVNRAELRLTTLHVPGVYRPRSNFGAEARPVLGEETIPLERAPLGDTTGVRFGIPPRHFEADGDSVVSLAVTRFVRGLVAAGEDTAVTERNRTLAVISAPEPIAYGIARFGGFGSGEFAPQLRLIVTVPVREEEE